jgi:signal transduction histidine kinase
MTPATAKPLPAAAQCELLLCQSPGCAWLLRHDGTFHTVYGDASRVFGRPAAELESLNFADLFAPPARLSWIGRCDRVFLGETLGAAARFSDAGPAFSVTLFPVRSPEGEIAFAGGIAHEMPEASIILRTLETLETDRARLSQLLHDRIGQNLSSAGLQLDLLRMDLASSGAAVPQRLVEIQAILDTVMEVVRNVNRELHPAVAERIGLRGALDRLAGQLRADFKGNVRVLADATAQPSPEAAAALYRIAEEAAGHAARRSGCSAIEILLKSLRNGPALEIRDNGTGFDVTEGAFRRARLEFLLMQHFADRAGLELEIESGPGKGTVVRALVGQAVRPAKSPIGN